jgi:O-antigen ligase
VGLLNMLAVGIGLFFLGRRFARGQRWLPTAPILVLGVFLIEIALSIPGSLDVGVSVKAWARAAGYMGIALLACESAQNENSIMNTLRGVVIAALPPMAIGYYQAFTGRGYHFLGYEGTLFAFRPLGTFSHPAILASFLVIVSGLVLAAYLWRYPLFPRLILLGLMAACLGLLVLTYARTEWIGGIITLGVIAIFRDRRFLLVIGGFGLLSLMFVPAVRERLQGEQASESLQWRLTVWDASLTILQKPTVFGSGLDTSPILINKVLYNVDSPPHNDYLRTAIESGIAGLVIFLLLQVAVLSQGWRAYRRAMTLSSRVIGLTLVGIIMGGFVISISDNYFSYVSVQWYTWTFVGLLAAIFSNAHAWRDRGSI